MSHTNGSFANESFAYDNNGNANGAGFTTTTGNEQTASPGYTYGYDNAGEMTSMTQTSTGNVWAYSYDFRDRMTSAVEKNSGGTTLASATFTYDALDNRIGRNENSTQTWTLYDRGIAAMDFNGSGSLTMRYLWGPTGIIARQTSGGTVSWYLADDLGSVRDIVNNSGSIIDHVDFSAFGTVLGETSPSSGDRITGVAMLERDTPTGLNLAVYREENPRTGRWDSQDPLGLGAGDANLYRYVGNGPTDAVDPTGMIPTWLSDYWYYLNPLNCGDPNWGSTGTQIAKIGCDVVGVVATVATGVVTATGVGGTVIAGGGATTGGGAAVGGGAAAGGVAVGTGVGTVAVGSAQLGAGTWPALLINGTVYIGRFHAVALELAGGSALAGQVQKYGMVIVDAAGTVIGWK